MRAHTRVRACVRAYAHTRVHTRARACVRTQAYAHTRVHAHARTRTCAHTCAQLHPKCSVKFRAFYTGSSRVRACVRAYAHVYISRVCPFGTHTLYACPPKEGTLDKIYTPEGGIAHPPSEGAHMLRVCPFGTHTPIYRNTRAHTRARIMKKGVENSQTVFPRGCLYTTTETISYLRGFSRYTFPQGAKYPEDISGHIMPSHGTYVPRINIHPEAENKFVKSFCLASYRSLGP